MCDEYFGRLLDQLDRMDEILVMDGGRIVQRGSFDALGRTPGLFRTMQEGETGGLPPHAAGEDIR